MKRTFIVYKHVRTETEGKDPEYRVVLKHNQNILTLVSANEDLFKLFPRGLEFQVTIKKEQQTIG